MNAQTTYLEHLAVQKLPQIRIQPDELAEKEEFRARLQKVCEKIVLDVSPPSPVALRLAPFGSISSGFAMPGSDMDLSLMMTSEVPGMFRMIEKALLDAGIGAHLLTRTRVPILKVCEKPSSELLSALREEREKWDAMTLEEREKHDSSARHDPEPPQDLKPNAVGSGVLPTTLRGGDEHNSTDNTLPTNGGTHDESRLHVQGDPQPAITSQTAELAFDDTATLSTLEQTQHPEKSSQSAAPDEPAAGAGDTDITPPQNHQAHKPRPKRQWYREKRLGPLDFPKDGVGVQCDINTANPLGIHNTLLLRCYSHCDPRIQSMVLFVKAWASKRQINSSRNGTLSSYGYVLMVLHFLVNVANPPVCPNLQLARQTPYAPDRKDLNAYCEGRDVRFWRNEAEIKQLAAKGLLTHNRDPLGLLLRNFFAYYAEHNGFIWTKQVLSLRTPGGILTKEQKGWTGAKTMMLDKVCRAGHIRAVVSLTRLRTR